jgi:hypothetical protein
MKIKVEITVADGTFVIEREIGSPTALTGPFSGFGVGVVKPASDAAIIDARSLLGVLPTIITAVNNEFASIAATPTNTEAAVYEKTAADAAAARRKKYDEDVAQIIHDGVVAGTSRSEMYRQVCAARRIAGVERITLKQFGALVNAELDRIAETNVKAADIDENTVVPEK